MVAASCRGSQVDSPMETFCVTRCGRESSCSGSRVSKARGRTPALDLVNLIGGRLPHLCNSLGAAAEVEQICGYCAALLVHCGSTVCVQSPSTLRSISVGGRRLIGECQPLDLTW